MNKPLSRTDLSLAAQGIFTDAFVRTNAGPSGAPLEGRTTEERLQEFGEIAERLNHASRSTRLNAAGVIVLARQLEELDTKLYEVKYPGLIAGQVVPVRTGIDPGADTYTYQVMDIAGRPRRSGAQSNDMPELNIAGSSTSQSLFSWEGAVSYTVQELRRFAMAGFGIDSAKAMAGRKIFAINQEIIICTGDSAISMTGIANNASVSLVSPTTGTWSTATADQVYTDLTKVVNAVFTGSKGIHSVNTVLLPPSLYVIADTLRLPNTAITVLEFFKSKNPGIDVRPWPYLETAGASSVPRIVVGEFSPENAEALAPVVFETFAPQIVGVTYKVPMHQRLGGVVVRYPGAFRYMDGC